jgi:hypothetical protein
MPHTSPAISRFFIAGCQRTGTTLLRLILECHPCIQCFDETQAYRLLANPDGMLRPTKMLGYKIPRWTEQLADGNLADVGLPEQARAFYDRDPILFMVRDVRDTVASMMLLKANSHSWLEAYGRPILDSKIAQVQFRQRFAREIAILESTGRSSAAVAAMYWKYKTQSLFDYRQLSWPVHAVFYETLVSNPEPNLRSIVRFLRLRWDRALLNHPRFPHAEVAPCGRTIGQTDPKRPIEPSSVGQWHHVLSPAEEADVMAIAEDLMERLYVPRAGFGQDAGTVPVRRVGAKPDEPNRGRPVAVSEP